MEFLLIIRRTKEEPEVIFIVKNETLSILISEILDGHSEAFDALYRQTYNAVYFHTKRILKNNEDALDAVQDTYTVAFQKLHTLQDASAVQAWLCGIAGNICYNKLRKYKHESGMSLDDDSVFLEPMADERETPEQILDRDSTHQIVSEMIERLPELQKLTVVMFYYDDLTVAQIAEAMGCPENTVKSRLNYARKNLEAQVLAEEKRGVKLYGFSHVVIVLALKYLAGQTVMPEAAVAQAGAAIAQQCGYALGAAAAAVGATGATGITGTTAGVGMGLGAKITAGILAAAVAVGGTVAGISIHNRNTLRRDILSAAEEMSAPVSEVSPAQAEAYYNILFDIVSQNGICKSNIEGPGLAYAELIDFDNDGNKELYLFYLDKLHNTENNPSFGAATGRNLWCLHEQVWYLDGKQALLAYEQTHYNAGCRAGIVSTGRILYASDGSTYLSSFIDDTHMGCCSICFSEQEFTGETFENRLGADCFFVGAEEIYYYSTSDEECKHLLTLYDIQFDEGANNFLFYFVSGAIEQNGITQSYSADDCQIIYDRSKSISHVRYSVVGENPFSIIDNFRTESSKNGHQVIERDYYDKQTGSRGLRWEICDVQALMDKLSKTSGIASANAESRSGDTTVFAYVPIVNSIIQGINAFSPQYGVNMADSRCALYDCDGDGKDELVTVYQSDKSEYGCPVPMCEIYDVDENGNAYTVFSTMMSPANNYPYGFVELTYNGEKYLAFYTHFPASGDEPWNDPEPVYSTTYRLFGMKDGELAEVHQIDSRGNGGTADGALISQEEFDAVANSARCVAWLGYAGSEADSMPMESKDIALNPQAFIELYSQ